MDSERRRSTDPLENTIKKIKNSGYVAIAGLLLNAGMMYQSNRDFTETQKAINARQQLTNEQQGVMNSKYDTVIAELRSNTMELKAVVAGQNRRIEMLENKSK